MPIGLVASVAFPSEVCEVERMGDAEVASKTWRDDCSLNVLGEGEEGGEGSPVSEVD